MDLQTNEPTVIRAGDSVAWTRELPEYSAADGWTLKYRLLWPAGSPAVIASTGVGTRHSVALSAADTATYTAGTATLVAYVERQAGATLYRVTLESQTVTVLPNLAVSTAHDGRSANKIALDATYAALASYTAKGQSHVAEYDIAGRRMKFRDSADIIALIQFYERAVAKESAALAVMNGVAAGRVQVRF